MAKSEVTFTLYQKSTHGGSVRFDAKESDTKAVFRNGYAMRDVVKDQLGISNLDSVKELEVTVRVKSSGKKKKDEDDDEDDD